MGGFKELYVREIFPCKLGGSGAHQVALSRLAVIKELNAFLACLGNRIFGKYHKKTVVKFVLDIRNTRSWLQFPFLNKGIGKLFFHKGVIRIHQRVLYEIFVQFIAKGLIDRASQFVLSA